MTETIAEKMYLAAKKVNDLNDFGKVKAFSSNEKGYARILLIKRGCAIWIHHLKNDQLTIGLLVTGAAEKLYPVTTNSAIRKFKEFAGNELLLDEFKHSINKSDKRTKHYINVANNTFDEIDIYIERLLMVFSDIK
jgi:hypothetical protein